MRVIDGTRVYWATDLCDFLACEHLAQLKLRVAEGEDIPRDRSALSDVLSRLGTAHEDAYLEQLRERLGREGKRLKTFDAKGAPDLSGLAALRFAAAETEAAMRQGYDAIYQATFFDGRWFGRADFLFRVERDSAPTLLGAYGYEVGDAKLARRVRDEAILQLCEYSRHVERIQGSAPERMTVILGDLSEHEYPVADYSAYHTSVRQRFDAAMGEPRPSTYPLPVDHCRVCDFASFCDAQRRHDDHLSLVARIRRDQIGKLQTAGVPTMGALAAMPVDVEVPRLATSTLDSLREQARMQHHGPLTDGTPRHELLEAWEPGSGLCALPKPSPGDVFFDMEGDALARDQQLEYLFGVVDIAGGEPRYHRWLGHDAAGERLAFEGFIDWVIARLDAYPDMHIFHYAAYERNALQRLMGRYVTREAEVDRLLRGQVLVDLYRVVRQSLRLSTESYGLKQVERLYMPARDGAIADASSSIVAYEQWLQSGAGEEQRDAALLEDIIRYNEADCVSTWRLRVWLETQRTVAQQQRGLLLPRPPPIEGTPPPSVEEVTEAAETLRAQLIAALPAERHDRNESEQAQWLLAQLLGYHRRENKVGWWRYFTQLQMTPQELEQDTDALGPLTPRGVIGEEKLSEIYRYEFAPQEHRIRAGGPALTPRVLDGVRVGESAGEVWNVNNTLGTIDLKRGREAATRRHPVFLIPRKPFDTRDQQRSLLGIGRWVAAHGIDAPGEHRAARDLLLRRGPRLAGAVGSGPVRATGESAEAAAIRAVNQLDGGCLALQGPPGSGKTYTAARAALACVTDGRRVAVTAVSHRAVGNLLAEICRAARESGRRVRVMQRAAEREQCAADEVQLAAKNDVVFDAVERDGVDIVGGTAWLFSAAQMGLAFDTLIVDEAGQMSLADVIAVSQCARNIVLVGDPRQLSHVVQGSHPDGADLSALEHVLGSEATISAHRGVFLDRTWRMRPDVCEFVSRSFYAGRLESGPGCARQTIAGDGAAMTGLRLALVEHDADRTSSRAEAHRVREVIESLLGRRWCQPDGIERTLTLNDILVVAPYNAHVACLTDILPQEARIGTVDKFQGQEAAVSIFSMATSSVDDLPRNLEFLYSLNRLNVAVSRARCLSVLVCSPQLLHARCHSPEQMRLVNALCRYAQTASPWGMESAAGGSSPAPARQLSLLSADMLGL